MREHQELTHEYLTSILSYSPITGIFRWKRDRGRYQKGSVAGCRNNDGRGIAINILGEQHRAGSLAIFYMTGNPKRCVVKHINGDKYDCRYENLKPLKEHTNV